MPIMRPGFDVRRPAENCMGHLGGDVREHAARYAPRLTHVRSLLGTELHRPCPARQLRANRRHGIMKEAAN